METKNIVEKELRPVSGMLALLLIILGIAASTAAFVFGIIDMVNNGSGHPSGIFLFIAGMRG